MKGVILSLCLLVGVSRGAVLDDIAADRGDLWMKNDLNYKIAHLDHRWLANGKILVSYAFKSLSQYVGEDQQIIRLMLDALDEHLNDLQGTDSDLDPSSDKLMFAKVVSVINRPIESFTPDRLFNPDVLKKLSGMDSVTLLLSELDRVVVRSEKRTSFVEVSADTELLFFAKDSFPLDSYLSDFEKNFDTEFPADVMIRQTGYNVSLAIKGTSSVCKYLRYSPQKTLSFCYNLVSVSNAFCYRLVQKKIERMYLSMMFRGTRGLDSL